MKRKEIDEILDVYLSIDGMSLDEMEELISLVRSEYKDHYDVRFDLDVFGGEDERDSYVFRGKRLENDKEFERRKREIEKEKANKKAAKKRKEEEERELLKKLKAKYEE